MARLVGYKVNDDSSYSTFEKLEKIEESDEWGDKRPWWDCTRCCCCRCFDLCPSDSKETVSDDIEFALIKYVQEVQSSPGGPRNRIIVPTKELLESTVRLKCSSRTGTTSALDHGEDQTSIKNLCTDEEEHNSALQREGALQRKRRGAINAKQLAFLEKYRPKSRLKKNGHKNSCCVQ
ncbi:uncharacterized protein LOC108906746 [Anoplophora glabripennis]|uniref:uncharacterized protein LOC108906746 n=1 Tax=Anoplophora glabripennis TaxID=217634 RepID=UPI000874ABC1|nr:uncharacterized protein LOC108906746 [Anoplophora glabripennis]